MYVDLHVHLRGTLTSATARQLASKNDVSGLSRVLPKPNFGWTDFSSFLHTYDMVTSVIQSAEDLERVAFEYLDRAGAENTIYVEFMLSPRDLIRTAVPFPEQVAAVSRAATRAKELSGIECRLIATAVRHLGPAAAVEAARLATEDNTGFIVGFGLTGDEYRFGAGDFREAFKIARSGGLKTTAHAGEHLSAESIIEAVEELCLDRVGHGVRAVESKTVMSALSKSRVALEVCLSSNLGLGLYQDLSHHPIRELVEAGCVVVLGSDDPSFFGTSPRNEYLLAEEALPNGPSQYLISKQAIEAAFCSTEMKECLLDGLF